MSAFILVSALLLSIGTYIDKMIIDEGISKKNYFYYMCLTMVPFSLALLYVEIVNGTFHFRLNTSLILLIVIAAVLRYYRQKSFVNCYRELQPYEFESYMTVSLMFSFIIDLFLGVQKFHPMKILSIVLILVGIFLINSLKIQMKVLLKNLFIRIFCELMMGYVIFAAMKQCSNSMFILILNLSLVIVFTPVYQPWKKQDRITGKLFWLIMLQQTFGFTVTYLNNILSSVSVTLYQFVSPVSLVLIAMISLMMKNRKKPSLLNGLGVICSIAGVLIMNVMF